MRIYATALAAARAHAGKRGANRVENWNTYVDRLVRSGVIVPAPKTLHHKKGWDHGWCLASSLPSDRRKAGVA